MRFCARMRTVLFSIGELRSGMIWKRKRRSLRGSDGSSEELVNKLTQNPLWTEFI